MALEIHELRRPADGAFYIAPARLYTTAAGELCAEDDPAVAFLLAAAGGQIPTDEARKYGLIADAEDDLDEKEAKPKANKGRKDLDDKGEGA